MNKKAIQTDNCLLSNIAKEGEKFSFKNKLGELVFLTKKKLIDTLDPKLSKQTIHSENPEKKEYTFSNLISLVIKRIINHGYKNSEEKILRNSYERIKQVRFDNTYKIKEEDFEVIKNSQDLDFVIDFINNFSGCFSEGESLKRIQDLMQIKKEGFLRNFIANPGLIDNQDALTKIRYYNYNSKLIEILPSLNQTNLNEVIEVIYNTIKEQNDNLQLQYLLFDLVNFIPYVSITLLKKILCENLDLIKTDLDFVYRMMNINDFTFFIHLGNLDDIKLKKAYDNYKSKEIHIGDARKDEKIISFLKDNIKTFNPLDENLSNLLIDKGYYKVLFNNINLIDNNIVADKFIELGHADFISSNLQLFNSLDSKYLDKLFGGYYVGKVLENLNVFKGLDQKSLIIKLINERKIREICNYITSFDSSLHPYIIEKILDNGSYNSCILNNLDKFVGINHNELIDKLFQKSDYYCIASDIDKFVGINHNELVLRLLDNNAGFSVLKNFEKFIGIDIDLILQKLIEKEDYSTIGNYLDKFIKVDGRYALKFIKYGHGKIVTENLDKLENLPKKLESFLSKIKSRKNDLLILGRFSELHFINNFDEIFEYCIENKQKSLIPLMNKLLIAKDLDFSKRIKKISSLAHITWVKDSPIIEAKEKLSNNYIKLLELTKDENSGKKIQEFSRFLSLIKEFNDNKIQELKKYFANPIIAYFEIVFTQKLRSKIVGEFPINNNCDISKIIDKYDFIEVYKMYKKAKKNKENFKKILTAQIEGNKEELQKNDKNEKWLIKMKNFKKIKLFLEKNELVIDINVNENIDETEEDIRHFLNMANIILKQLGLEEIEDYGKLLNYFDSNINKNKLEIKQNISLNEEEFNNLFNDLELQIKSIKDILQRNKAKIIPKIKIYKEQDPIKVLMMGNRVDGSCLSFYNGIGNFWSTATNALDINKAVYYIEDSEGNVIGRVLVAIDNDGKIVRFPLYKKGNISIDLNNYFNKYIQKIAEKCKLGINGKASKVELLNGEDWYKDPEYEIK